MSGVQALSVVRNVLKVNGATVQTLAGGTQGPEGGTGPVGPAGPAGSDIAGITHAATSKATPVDADEMPLADSAATFGLKKLTWANLKATLKAYFDTLYVSTIAPLVIASANVVEQRNGATAQLFRVMNTYTDASNREQLELGFNGTNTALIRATAAGTGTVRPMQLSAASFLFSAAGTSAWNIGATCHFTAATDNAFDIGANGVNRPRTVYVGTGVITPTVQTSDTTVAGLPAAAAGTRGQRRHVTDSTVAASGNFGATVAGGGANVVPVFCTGAAWIIA